MWASLLLLLCAVVHCRWLEQLLHVQNSDLCNREQQPEGRDGYVLRIMKAKKKEKTTILWTKLAC